MKKQQSRKITKILVILLAIMLVIPAVTLLVILSSDSYVQLDTTRLNDIHNNLTVLDIHGEKINQPLYVNSKKYVSIDDIPQHVIDAFVSVEDKRFWQHNGTDLVRVLGATIKNVKSMSFREGASTITQQLIKNTHLDNNKNIKRKINEMHLARQLERKFDKNKILEMYLNTIYFGDNHYGIEVASNCYFDCTTSQLSIEQGAILAGLVKSPNVYSPTANNKEKCQKRRNTVLKLMLDQNKITHEQYQQLSAQDITIIAYNNIHHKSYMYGVIEEACKITNMTPIQLLNSRLTITTYYDPNCQASLEQAIDNDNTKTDEGLSDIVALSCDNLSGGIKAMYIRGNGNIDMQSRQIGSTAKPIAVYAPAIDKNKLSCSSTILDEECNFSGYKPNNYNNKYYGWVTATTALSKSLNTCAVKTLNNIGVDVAESYLKKMGIPINKQHNLSLALGNLEDGMNAYQLAQCYTTLANNGKYNNTVFIQAIKNQKSSIYNNTHKDISVFQPSTAYLTTYMLQDAVNNGTAKQLKQLGYDVATKTGTVGNHHGNTDAICCSYTTDSTFVVWMRGNMPNTITGGTAPTSLTKQILQSYYCKQNPTKFTLPNSIQLVDIDKVQLDNCHTTEIATIDTRQDEVLTLPYSTDNMPTKLSDRHKKIHYLDAKFSNNSVMINIPTDTYEYKIFKEYNGIIEQLQHTDNLVRDTDIVTNTQYTYYAKVYANSQLLYTTAKYTLTIPPQGNNNDMETSENNEQQSNNSTDSNTDNNNDSILHWWYLGK